MKIKAHWVSHLVVLVLLLLGTVLLLRLQPAMSWWPSPDITPVFAPDDLPTLSLSEAVPAAPVPAPIVRSAASPDPVTLKPKQTPPSPTPTMTDAEVEAKLFVSWFQARQLLRQRDLVAAQAAYLELVEDWPEHPDLVGELGNVYVLMGRETEAQVTFQHARDLLMPLGPSVQLRAVASWLKSRGQ